MMSSFLGLVSILTGTFVVPFAGAATPVNLSLPQETNYVEQISAQLGQATFATDPATTTGLVAAAQNQPQGALLEAFLVNYHPCVRTHDVLAYRAFIRNVGDQTAHDVVAQFQYPPGVEFRMAVPPPSNFDPDKNIIEWQLGDIAPGHHNGVELHITLVVTGAPQAVSTHLSVVYVDDDGNQRHTLTSHTVRGNCDPPPNFESKPLPNKLPAIICDPAEQDCQGGLPNLGFNFDQVKRNANKVPTVCSPNDPRPCNPNDPELGVRFLEAVADIPPGECSVLDDDIIITPEYHDSLNRRADPAAVYLMPLYQVHQDFIELMHKNELFGLQNIIATKKTLRNIHNSNWQQYEAIVGSVISGRITLDQALQQFDESRQTWVNAIGKTQRDDLKETYEIMQEEQRQDNFWPIICGQDKYEPDKCKAVNLAKESVKRACSDDSDGGLAQLLPGVKQSYDAALNERTALYPDAQTKGLQQYQQQLNQQRTLLEQAIEEVKAKQANNANDPNAMEPLIEHQRQLIRMSSDILAVLTKPYSDHQYADKKRDFKTRLEIAEIALDTPKTVATDCQKDIDFGPQVATTWCESGNYPEYIIEEARQPDKRDIAPPALINGGEQAQINIAQVIGTVCGGRPGDPYWSPSCSCHCNQKVRCGPKKKLTLCQFCPPGVTHHDILVTTQQECLWENADDHIDADG